VSRSLPSVAVPRRAPRPPCAAGRPVCSRAPAPPPAGWAGRRGTRYGEHARLRRGPRQAAAPPARLAPAPPAPARAGSAPCPSRSARRYQRPPWETSPTGSTVRQPRTPRRAQRSAGRGGVREHGGADGREHRVVARPPTLRGA
jgi:hypothetical protein